MPAQTCVDRFPGGLSDHTGDHLLLTPAWPETSTLLEYTVQHTAPTGSNPGGIAIHVCNPTTGAVNDGTTAFNLLVFDAN